MLIESVKDLKDMERKKGSSYFENAVIPFIPEKTDSALGKNEFVELTLRVNKDMVNRGVDSNLVKKRVKIFSHGNLEDLLLWKIDVEDVINRKPCSSGLSKFGMVEMLLRSDPLHTWRAIREKETASIVPGGDLANDMLNAYSATMRKFCKHYFPKHVNAARRQHSYLQCSLFKPKTVAVSQVVSRLRVLNSFLPYFPEPENVALDEGALIDIVLQMCTAKWRNNMLRVQFEPHDHTLDEVQTKLEISEVLEKVEQWHLGTEHTDEARGTSRGRKKIKGMPGAGASSSISPLVCFVRSLKEMLSPIQRTNATRRGSFKSPSRHPNQTQRSARVHSMSRKRS